MKSRGGKSAVRERQKKEAEKREKVRRKKMQLRKKEEKSRNTLFSQCFGARKDRKVGSPKRRVATFRNQNCEKLPGSAKAHLEAQLEVKMLKNTPFLHHLKVELLKKCTLLWRETDFEVKPVKELSGSELFWIEMSKKCTLLWREAHLKVKMVKAHHSCSTFGSCAVENVHAIVAGSTFRSQNC